MTEQLTGYEASSVAEIGAILDAMPPDADTVYLDTIAYSERAIAAVAAKRAGGGSLPAQWVVDANGNLQVHQSAAAANPPHAILALRIAAASTDFGLRVEDDTGARVASVSSIVDAVRCSFGGYGSDFVGDDPIAGEDQETGNVIFEVKDGGGINVWASDGSTLLFSVSSAGAVSMPQIPTSDPAIAGQLYSVAGVVHISAG